MTSAFSQTIVAPSAGENRPESFLKFNRDTWLVLFAVLCTFAVHLPATSFAPDSWSYYELSRSVFGDFYRANTIRQFEFHSDYGSSFPPLYPVLIAASRAVYDGGIYNGSVLNVGFCIATFFILRRLCIKIQIPTRLAVMFFFALLCHPDYIDEVLAGGSIPLALVLHLSLATLYLSADLTRLRTAAAMGLLAGLAVLARFDMAIVAAVLGLVSLVAIKDNRHRLRFGLVYYAIFFVCISPWMIYSWNHFDKPFVSDNSRVVMIAGPAYVYNYYPASSPPPLLKDEPALWLKTLATTKFKSIARAIIKIPYGFFPLQILAGIGIGALLFKRREQPQAVPPEIQQVKSRFHWLWLVYAAQISQYFLIGYADARYFLLAILMFLIYAAFLIYHAGYRQHVSSKTWSLLTWTMLAVTIGVFLSGKNPWSSMSDNREAFRANRSTVQYKDVLDVVTAEKNPRLLFMDTTDINSVMRFGALSGITVAGKPNNLTPETFLPFLDEFQFTHIYDPQKMWLPVVGSDMFVPLEVDGLYRVKKTKPN